VKSIQHTLDRIASRVVVTVGWGSLWGNNIQLDADLGVRLELPIHVIIDGGVTVGLSNAFAGLPAVVPTIRVGGFY
jgi:hypothetical protein